MKYTKWIMQSAFMLVGSYSCIYGGPQKNSITKEQFDTFFPSLVKEIIQQQTDINNGRNKPLNALYYYLKLWKGYDDYTYNFLELSFPFFDSQPSEIEQWLKSVDLDRVNAMLAQCNDFQNAKNPPFRARVAYYSLLEATLLPQDVDKSMLIDHPENFKQLVEKQTINLQKHKAYIAEGLVFRYYCEHIK
jgi:hypothetical protein